ncbi:hypothetical protein HK405_008717, partial [Cladochytrium tenue]
RGTCAPPAWVDLGGSTDDDAPTTPKPSTAATTASVLAKAKKLSASSSRHNLSTPPTDANASGGEASISNAVDAMTEQDVKWRLREALAVIKEKERDLIIAAEIGQQLVAANKSLASEYEELRKRAADGRLDGRSSPPRSPEAIRAGKKASLSLRQSGLMLANPDDMDEPGPITSPISSAPGRKLSRKSSNGIYEYVRDLERASADLREQLAVAIANLQDSEKIHMKTIGQLRQSNSALKDDLHTALRDVRNAEQAHNRAVSSLETDLEKLRSELSSTSLAALKLEGEKKKLAREKVDAIRESQDAESADSRVIYELQQKVRSLEDANSAAIAGRRESEKRLKQAREELDATRKLVAELQEQVEATGWLRKECERRGALVMELKEQLEDVRSSALDSSEDRMFQDATVATVATDEASLLRRRAAMNTELSLVLQKGGMEWQWTPWLTNVRDKVWERDINGLKDEIADLAAHREVAYVHLRASIDEMLTVLVQALPESFQAITTRVVGIPSRPLTTKLAITNSASPDSPTSGTADAGASSSPTSPAKPADSA